MEGFGEKITLIEKNDFDPYIVLAKPDLGINTKEAFVLYDKMMKTKEFTPLVLHKILSNTNKKEIQNLIKITTQKIDQAIDLICNCDFDINPKVTEKENLGCKYCKYKDICFKENKDEVLIKPDSNLSFLGGDTNA